MADREEAIKRLSEKRAEEFEEKTEEVKAEETEEIEDTTEDTEEVSETEEKAEEKPEKDDDLQRRLNEIAAMERQQQQQVNDPLADLESKYMEAIDNGEYEEAFRIQKQYNDISNQNTLNRVSSMLDQREATRNFRQDYPDIYNDPYLLGIADQQIREMTAKGVNIVEAADLAGRAVKQWREGQVPKEQKTDRHERKRRTVVNMPKATGRTTSKPEDKEPSPAEVIQQMKQARGQRV